MNPYPWYGDNKVTKRLGPYAVYAARRQDLERLYQPEPDVALIENGCLDVKALEKSFQGDEERHGWLSWDPIIREIVHMLTHDPAGFDRLATKINAEYMVGFQHKTVIDQARIHLMTACHLMGHWDDDIIAKKWLRNKGLELWARAWHRGYTEKNGIRRYFPTQDELNTFYLQLPPIREGNKDKDWPWERVYSSIGLAEMHKADGKSVK
jgi:hypothetical protein